MRDQAMLPRYTESSASTSCLSVSSIRLNRLSTANRAPPASGTLIRVATPQCRPIAVAQSNKVQSMQSRHSVGAPPYTPMTRVPLVPETVLRRHNVHFAIDPRFRRAARLLQYLWLKEQGIPTGIHVRGTVAAPINDGARLPSKSRSRRRHLILACRDHVAIG
jgi:hypothetical protein